MSKTRRQSEEIITAGKTKEHHIVSPFPLGLQVHWSDKNNTHSYIHNNPSEAFATPATYEWQFEP